MKLTTDQYLGFKAAIKTAIGLLLMISLLLAA
jgi:hypothetical protein